MAGALRSFVPGRDDRALWERLQAAATPAPRLTGEVDGPGAPRPVLGPIVRAAAFQESVTSGRRASFDRSEEFTFPTAFLPPKGSGDEGEPFLWETRTIGTTAEVVVGHLRPDGRRPVHVTLTHHFEPPAWLHWPASVWETGSSKGGVSVPGFQYLSLEGTSVLPPGQPRLVVSGTVSPPLQASAAPRRRLLVFARFSDSALQ